MESTNFKLIASESVLMKRGHAEALLPVIQRVMRHVDGGFGVLEKIAVTLGPGSFTGIRVGISAAQGLALALDIPLVGVSTFAAFAAPLVLDNLDSVIVVAIDARHDQAYVQAFSPTGKTIVPPQVTTTQNAPRLLGKGPFRMTGSAGAIVMIESWVYGLRSETAGELTNPRIEFVARLGLSANPVYAPARPLYIKAVDATAKPFATVA
jgi:tRNA threonylcarbamoyladenosine biosynthesis protein TsaB